MPAPTSLIGLDAPDDAAVLRPPPGMLLVQSVDHFRAFIDDPFVFGQIAAAHALSDLHAMGARPWTALAIAAVPYASRRQDARRPVGDAAGRERGAARRRLRPGRRPQRRGGGGGAGLRRHRPGRCRRSCLRKSGLRPGDALILTKPLGTGIVLAGHMRGLTRAAWLPAAIASMRASNAAAARILRDARRHRVHRCHRLRPGRPSAGDAARLRRRGDAVARAVPALPGALELAAQGVESTLAPENRALVPNLGTEPRDRAADRPADSGGLLAGMPPERAEVCVTMLRNAGIIAAIIGMVERGEAMIRLELG